MGCPIEAIGVRTIRLEPIPDRLPEGSSGRYPRSRRIEEVNLLNCSKRAFLRLKRDLVVNGLNNDLIHC